MTRQEYLTQLEKYLKHLPQHDLQDTLDYFNEYFDDRADDQEAMRELGQPKEAAREILANLYDKEKEESKPKTSNLIWLSILTIMAAPIGSPLALALIALLISLLVLLFSALLLIACLWIVLFSLSLALLLLAFDFLSLSWTTSLLLTGAALVSLALALFGSKATVHLGSKAFLLVLHWVQSMIRKGDYHETA